MQAMGRDNEADETVIKGRLSLVLGAKRLMDHSLQMLGGTYHLSDLQKCRLISCVGLRCLA